jgi:Zn-dependent protease with chaperone function
MDSAGKLQRVRAAAKRCLKALWAGLVSAFFITVVIIFLGANISSCIVEDDVGDKALSIVEADNRNERHVKLARALYAVWARAREVTGEPTMFIAESPDINAASFGSGRFLVWDGVADLPDSMIDAIFAHEVAHDILRHSKKAKDVKDLTDFIGDILSVLGNADRGTEETLKKWVGYAALPKYSRTQEFDADAKAVQILTRMGHREPETELADALQFLLIKYGSLGGGFFDRHPSLKERLSRLRSGTGGGLGSSTE